MLSIFLSKRISSKFLILYFDIIVFLEEKQINDTLMIQFVLPNGHGFSKYTIDIKTN